jgi:hypothetical protein
LSPETREEVNDVFFNANVRNYSQKLNDVGKFNCVFRPKSFKISL